MKDILAMAEEAISEAEARLRQLMETALAKQRYVDVAKLAPLADGLLNVLKVARNGDSHLPALLPDADLASDRRTKSSGAGDLFASGGSRTSEGSYPRFERQGDRLVKIAWSKKDRREYEHRATANIILRVAELFERDRAFGTPFMMDSLMPFKTRTGVDIPSYQAYLALAWFRSLGTIEPRGKDGYVVVVENLKSRIESAWKSMPHALRR
jgi:hypothetical protein